MAVCFSNLFICIFVVVFFHSIELPEILIAPKNQTIKVGKSFVLECDADGNPQPKISWQLNGTLLTGSEAADGRVKLENENTELSVSAAQESDSGKYQFTRLYAQS